MGVEAGLMLGEGFVAGVVIGGMAGGGAALNAA